MPAPVLLLSGPDAKPVLTEFLAYSALFPLALLVLTICTVPLGQWSGHLWVLPAIGGGYLQAFFLAHPSASIPGWRRLAAHLIAPGLACIVLAAQGGLAALATPIPLVWWVTAVTIGCLRSLPVPAEPWATVQIATEHVLRASVLAALFAIADGSDLGGFLAQGSHVFVVAGLLATGLALGLSQAADRRHLAQLRATAGQLQEYSEWLLGRTLLTRAVSDRTALKPRRVERALLFMDIRGFTKWSEPRQPEEVLQMLAGFYVASEHSWSPFKPLKVKLTADEVFLVFEDPMQAARAALIMRDAVEQYLEPFALGAGIGLHFGPVIEGLLGAQRVRQFDVIGDTVNTAKRICDNTAAGEVLISYQSHCTNPNRLGVAPMTETRAKGKSSALILAPLLEIRDDPLPPGTRAIERKPLPAVAKAGA